jgi:hypothetical protein
MKKKLFLLLLIVALAAFVFTGCTPPTPSEGEGEGEGEIEGVVVDIDGAVELNGRTYVADGNHTITVTFPAPVANVNVYISDCTGDYSKQPNYYYNGTPVALWPNEDRTVWTGSGSFVCDPCSSQLCITRSECCASYVQVVAGECEGNVCLSVPVVVDCGKPYAEIEVGVKDCCCETCALVFKSTGTEEDPCGSCADIECCGDDCSGLASWQIDLYTVKNATWEHPEIFFDDCCGITPCAELVDTCTGIECPIKCETKCLDEGIYFAVITLEDNVGKKQTYYAQIDLEYDTSDEKCKVVEYQGLCCAVDGSGDACVTTLYEIGACKDVNPCPKPLSPEPVP